MAQDKARQGKTRQSKARQGTSQHSTQVPGRMHQQKPTTRGREGWGGAPVTLLSNPDFTTYVRDRRNGNWIPKEHLLHTRAGGVEREKFERKQRSTHICIHWHGEDKKQKQEQDPPPPHLYSLARKIRNKKERNKIHARRERLAEHDIDPDRRAKGCLTNHTINIINCNQSISFLFLSPKFPGRRR